MRVIVVGAGPTGLLATSLLQRTTSHDIALVEKRPGYTRDRRVLLSPFLLATSVRHYGADAFDADNVRAFFSPDDLADLFAAKRHVPADVRAALQELGQGFVPLNHIEHRLHELVRDPRARPVSEVHADLGFEDLCEMVEPGDVVIDCTGRGSLLRDALPSGRRDALYRQDPSTPPEARARGRRAVGDWEGNVIEFVVEHAVLVTFHATTEHRCDERCKLRGNEGNATYKVLPMVQRCYLESGTSHFTGIVALSEADFGALPPRLDPEWLHGADTELTRSIRRYLEQHIEPLSDGPPQNLSLLAIPLNLYRARHVTNVEYPWVGGAEGVAAFLLGDAAMGSPYFQSISVGLEGAMVLAWLLRDGREITPDLMWRFERFTSLQWGRIYMRSRQIQIHKAVLDAIDDTDRLLDLLTVF